MERLLAGEIQERGPRPLDPQRALLRARVLFTAGWCETSTQSGRYIEESLAISRQLGREGYRTAANDLYWLASVLWNTAITLRPRR